MGQRDFARAGRIAATHQRRRARTVVRCPEGPLPPSSWVQPFATHRGNRGQLQRLGFLGIRQQAGQARGQQRLAAARAADQQQMVPTSVPPLPTRAVHAPARARRPDRAGATASCPRAPRVVAGADCSARHSTPATYALPAHRHARPKQPQRHCLAAPPECARRLPPQSRRAAHLPPRSSPVSPSSPRNSYCSSDCGSTWPLAARMPKAIARS